MSFNSFGHAPTPRHEKGTLDEKQRVVQAMENLPAEGLAARDALYEPGMSAEEALHRIRVFNNLPARARGKGTNDAGMPVTERKEQGRARTIFRIPAGLEVEGVLEEDGEFHIEVNLVH